MLTEAKEEVGGILMCKLQLIQDVKMSCLAFLIPWKNTY